MEIGKILTRLPLLLSEYTPTPMKSHSIYATKSQLLDYVHKSEFNELKKDVRDFRDEFIEFRDKTDARFNSIDKKFISIDSRFNSLDRRFDELKEEFRIQTGVILQETRENFKTVMEYLKHLDEKKLDKAEYYANKKPGQ